MSETTEGTTETTPLERGSLASIPLGLEALRDVPMSITIELGRTRLMLNELLTLAPGSLVHLDRSVQEAVDLYVGDKLFARGEVVTVGAKYGLRITALG